MTENIPAAIGLPIALDLSGGLTPVLALAIPSTVQRSELDEFIARHGFVPRQQTAQAHASRTRWALELDGRLTVTFNTKERRARFQMPNEPEIQAWAAFAIARGGTVGIMILPEMDAPTAAAVALRTGMGSGEYWLLSAGLDV